MKLRRVSQKNSGFILLMVMAILAALTLLVINLLETVAVEKELSQDFSHKIRSRLLARSGIEYAIARSSSYETVRLNVNIKEKPIPVGNGTYTLDGDEFLLSLGDANGKININHQLLIIGIDWYRM